MINTDQAQQLMGGGTERRGVGRVRLCKYVVTENVTQAVPVSHEQIETDGVEPTSTR